MSARLSPAASLLRNSKLFALPPAIALPVAPPSSNEISRSETASTPFPRFAAIETTETSGRLGDWGFKRPLPSKTLRNTNNPVVRLVRGIDTAEHVADFESAADHVLTLRKFSELDHPLKLADTDTLTRGVARDLSEGVFRSTSDNTTNLSSTAPHYGGHVGIYGEATSAAVQHQLPSKLKKEEESPKQDNLQTSGRRRELKSRLPLKRWRYGGPSLTSITGEKFKEYLKGLGQEEIALLHDRIREEVVKDKQTRSRDEGLLQESFSKEEVTEQELRDYIRYLRNTPSVFGPMIAQVLDLPKVQPPKGFENNVDWWDYGPSTLASKIWAATGTPATHPSAGLSYATGAHSVNHPNFGPQAVNSPVVARAVKKSARLTNNGTYYGVAGFIMAGSERSLTLGQKPFEKTDGGMKAAVVPKSAHIHADGTLRMKVEETTQFDVLDDKAVTRTEVEEVRRSTAISAQAQGGREARPAPRFSERTTIKRQSATARPQRDQPSQESPNLDDILGRTGRR